MTSTLLTIETPALVLERPRLLRNIARMGARAEALGVSLRPHLKSAKSLDVLELLGGVVIPITVSTLKEAEVFAAHGVRDILYAVALSPQKAVRAKRLQSRGCELKVVVDSVGGACAIAQTGVAGLGCLIEIDTDGHRAGVRPDDQATLTTIADTLAAAGWRIEGVMAHAGESYHRRGDEALAAIAEEERSGALAAAEHLRRAGHSAGIVSVGSTPTALGARDLTGVTELRAGVYMFFDLVQAAVGICQEDDIALSVLATVIGAHPEKGQTFVDAGWTALSRDPGVASDGQPTFGIVCDLDGRPLGDLVVKDLFQEHGVLSSRDGARASLALPIGERVRILPNHACATASQHGHYNVVDGDLSVAVKWPRFAGW